MLQHARTLRFAKVRPPWQNASQSVGLGQNVREHAKVMEFWEAA
ncbi:MAG: hypothetical protein ACI9KE_002289 [Polyangiales bacterium]|jgi:hypothetical protein